MARSYSPTGTTTDAIEKKLVQMKPGGKRLTEGLRAYDDTGTGTLSSKSQMKPGGKQLPGGLRTFDDTQTGKLSSSGVSGRSFSPPKIGVPKSPTKKGKLQSEDLRKAAARRLTRMHRFSRNRAV